MTIPRRAQWENLTKAERAIYDALHEVEAMPADVRLTDAVVLLQAARHSVADFVDHVDQRRFVTEGADPEAERARLQEENAEAIKALHQHGGTEIRQGLAASIAMTLRSMNATRLALLGRAERAESNLWRLKERAEAAEAALARLEEGLRAMREKVAPMAGSRWVESRALREAIDDLDSLLRSVRQEPTP